MSIAIKDLEDWDRRILELVHKYGLNPYPQEFEICDHFEMIGYMAYSGMPSRYPHWSYGKAYEREKTLYDYSVGGLPYEMVINSNPCLAYLMRDNTYLLQILTIAHVYGHNDFFANNFTFTSGTQAKYALEMFRNHAQRIRRYMEDPSIGVEAVERILDAAHSLSLQRSRNLAIKQLSQEEQKQRLWEESQIKHDEFSNIHTAKKYEQPNLDKLPLQPDQNLLEFIATNHPFLADWERDLLYIVDREATYFIPQIETKIMNEGWASYWHHKLLNELSLNSEFQLEFLVRHNQVLRPTPGGLNPYHLGFVIWHDIEKRWNEGRIREEDVDDPDWRPEVRVSVDSSDENHSPGRKKIFEVRESDRDVSFLRRFLTPQIMRDLDLFQHEKRGKERVITKIADNPNWESIKETLIRSVGMGSRPVIYITDADFGGSRSLKLTHEHDGRDLQLDYAEQTLKHLGILWGKDVVLETTVNNRQSSLKIDGESLKVDRI